MASAGFPQRGSQTRRKTDGVLGEIYSSDPIQHTLTVRWPTIPGVYASQECSEEQFDRNWELTGVHLAPPRPSIVAPILIAVVAVLFFAYVVITGGGGRYTPYDLSDQDNNVPNAILNSAQALDAKYGLTAAQFCAAGADNYLRSIARYRFSWDDKGMYENKFDSFEPTVVAPGVLTLTSHNAKLSNGFGKFSPIELFCNFDTQGNEVLNFSSRPEDD